MSIRSLLASRRTTRASALVLAVCLGSFALLGAAPAAVGADAPDGREDTAGASCDGTAAEAVDEAEEVPPFRFTGRFGEGVCDTLWVWAHRLDEASQDVLTEQALQEARRADDASAADEAAEARAVEIGENGRYGDEVAASRDSQATAEAQALRAADGQTEGEGLAATGALPAHEGSDERVPISPSKASGDGPTSLICFLGEEIPYHQGGPADTSAPHGYASTWVGDGRVDDNANTYFIGHNPGVFARVMDLDLGDKITVFDDTGASRTYYVFDTLFLPNGSNYFAYEGRIAPTGESITLQTCTGDNKRVRCVMAR